MIEQPRHVAIPNLGDRYVAAAEDLAQALHALAGDPPPDAHPASLPMVLADGFALEAFDRIWDLVATTQAPGAGHRLVTPEGTVTRLSIVTLADEDLRALGDGVRALGTGLLRGNARITELLVAFADTAAPGPPPITPGDYVAAWAGLHGLLDLEWTVDSELLRQYILRSPDPSAEIQLDVAGVGALERLADRFASMWGAVHNDIAPGQEADDSGLFPG